MGMGSTRAISAGLRILPAWIPQGTRSQRGLATALLVILGIGPSGALAATAEAARRDAIGWLESRQNQDGSWGESELRPIVTAEALLALATAGRGDATAARRASAWLLNQEFSSLDYRGRAIRALTAAGIPMQEAALELDALGSLRGWGPTSGEGVTSYDTALVLAGIRATGTAISDLSSRTAEVIARQRTDAGWSGDGIEVEMGISNSDRSVSGEIVRALASFYADWGDAPTPPADPNPRFAAQKFLSTDTGNGGAGVDAGSETLELATRLAALHAVGEVDATMKAELLDDVRFVASGPLSVWSADDAFVNALGLLALATEPGAVFSSLCADDWDCDEVLDQQDAFPYDPDEHADLDLDGVGDNADPDRDGDGYCDPGETGPECTGTDLERFASDPRNHADSDGDGIGDNDETDADNDGKLDWEEMEEGTDPRAADPDSDGVLDGEDPCPLIAYEDDRDGDGVCAPLDECDNVVDPRAMSAVDLRNLDGDNLCDEADDDDDGDGFADGVELVWGSDPRDRTSVPDDVAATDPDGDFDADGLSNFEEANHVDPSKRTSPFFADSDGDGALDGEELYARPTATDPWDPASRPGARLAVLSSAGAGEPIQPGGYFEPALSSLELVLTATGGQPTPVATGELSQDLSTGTGMVSLAGFQPQTTIGRDLDGDGLSGAAETALSTSHSKVDTDGDRFVDGPGGVVPSSRYGDGFDLDGDTFVEGELSLGTDPANAEDRAGAPGDVAPLGFPNARLDTGDLLVGWRLASDPALLGTLSADGEAITREAADLDEDGVIGPGDVLQILNAVDGANP